jgi:4-amino-4-deoxy-L-arabinose transferase-like glycosyltransferase
MAVGIFTICYLAFLTKSFHVDDPLFIWVAKQIARHPLDFYGFEANWAATARPFHWITKNPPLASYYMAAFGSIFGWSEPVLHLAFLLPAAGALIATCRFARGLCSFPGEAALVAAFTPAFFVSSTTVMCDVALLCVWCWAIVFWKEGLERPSHVRLLLASGLVAVAALTKYFGIALLPLLAAYAVARTRRVGAWLAWLAVPALLLLGYEALTRRLYGHAHLLYSVGFSAAEQGVGGSPLSKLVLGLTFMGGCCLSVIFFALELGSRRAIALWAGVGVLCIAALTFFGRSARIQAPFPGLAPGQAVQAGIFITVALGIAAIAVADLSKNRDADSILLSLWVFGTFAFAAFFNWTVSARALVPMTPALGILLMRRLETQKFLPNGVRTVWKSIGIAALTAILVAYADLSVARSAKDAATEISVLKAPSRTVWFEGHWGWQYYAQLEGLKPIDFRRDELRPGDLVIVPENNTATRPLPLAAIRETQTTEYPTLPWISTTSWRAGAGFYSAKLGPLPFAIGKVPPERYRIFEVIARIIPPEHAVK